MKILIVTPKFPYPPKGACEQDMAQGIEHLIKLGHDVHVITKIYNENWLDKVWDARKKLGIKIVPICYKYTGRKLSFWEKVKKIFLQLSRPWYLDGAAFEYTDPKIRQALKEALDSFEPDIVWFDYTYLWPLYKQVKKRGIQIITRSINVEAYHFLDEDGRGIINYIKFLPKLITELIMCRLSDAVLAITPKEQKWYKKYCKKYLDVLPLRALPQFLPFQATVVEKEKLDVFFFGSTYNVAHNLSALKFLLKEIIPKVRKHYTNKFVFNIFGGKIPKEMESLAAEDVIIHGYLSKEELEEILKKMDIAIIPSLYGAGMQQKIFEPLARGIPTIASARGIADYPFKNRQHILLAESVEDFVESLNMLQDIDLRKSLSKNSKELCKELFSKEKIDTIVSNAIKKVLL